VPLRGGSIEAVLHLVKVAGTGSNPVLLVLVLSATLGFISLILTLGFISLSLSRPLSV
jgi:hypothetical protein